MRVFHVFEEWADVACASSRQVAELITGTRWAWTRDRIAQSDPTVRAGEEWGDVAVTNERITQFAARVSRPPNLDREWIEGAIDEAPARPGPPPAFLVDHEFTRAGCNAECGALQLIQVSYGTPNLHHDVGRELSGWWVWVDAGRYSPWHIWAGYSVGHPDRAYFYGPKRHRTECDGQRIALYDQPGAVVAHEQLYFEACAICVGHQGQPLDRVLRAIRYGWRNHGSVRRPVVGGPDADAVEADHVSDWFVQILGFDYPGHQIIP